MFSIKLTGKKWKDFLAILPTQTSVHLRRLLVKFPNHKYRNEIIKELKRRK